MAKKAPPANGDAASASIRLRVFDGTRVPIAGRRKYLVRLLNGMQKEIEADYFSGPAQTFSVPFYDNLSDNYAVLVTANGASDAGFFPVAISPDASTIVDLMLLPKPFAYDFERAAWDTIKATVPQAFAALAFGASSAGAKARYDAFLDADQAQAAALWNILTSMGQAHLPQLTAINYLREIIWDGVLAPAGDRFFGYADSDLIDQMELAVAQGTFAPEPNPALFHPDATRSFKQTAFGEANLQLTFHEGDTKTVGGRKWVRLEPDIDYYKDLAAHALLEVLPNTLTGGKTDPAMVYVLRWIAGRRAGFPEFDPPYVIVPSP